MQIFVLPHAVLPCTCTAQFSAIDLWGPLGSFLDRFLCTAPFWSVPYTINFSCLSVPGLHLCVLSSTGFAVGWLIFPSLSYAAKYLLGPSGVILNLILFAFILQGSPFCAACCPTSKNPRFVQFVQFSSCLRQQRMSVNSYSIVVRSRNFPTPLISKLYHFQI